MKHTFKSFFVVCLLIVSSALFAGCELSDFFGQTDNTYTVTFNLMYSGATNTQVMVEEGHFVQELQATREGYTMLGWYSDSSYNFLFNFATPVNGDLNLYAKWQINTYTLTLDKRYDGLSQIINYTYGDTITLPTLTRSGYTFGGWYFDSTFNSAATNSSALNQTVTLYAKWTLNNYSISVVSSNTTYGTVGLNYNTTNNYVTITASPKSGYAFDGWFVGSTVLSLNSQYSFTATASMVITGKFKVIPTSDVTITASSGIQISLDGMTWKSSIATADLGLSFKFDPVSTDGTVTDGDFNFYTATYGDGEFTLAADTHNYATFDLYFLNQGASDLTLSLASISSLLDDAVNDMDTSLTMRVGFIIEGSSNDPSTALALMNGTSSYIWEPNSTARSVVALASGAVDSAKYYYDGVVNDNGGVPISNLNAYGQFAAGTYTSLVNSNKDLAIGDSPIIGTLTNASVGQITKVKIYIWTEGQDVDCNNATAGGDLDITLAFDSGTTTLNSKTATEIITTSENSSVTLTGTGNVGATYTVYALQESTDATVSLGYVAYISEGTATYTASNVSSITLNDLLISVATYKIVVTARLTGYISSRTSTTL
ncbi:MAG: InlB B-repeat-containing protein [Spirochaetales bacterium]